MLMGERVRLRALERSDLLRCAGWLNDPDVARHLTAHVPLSMAQEEQWFERLLGDKDRHILAIETEDGTHIGNIGIEDLNWKDRSAGLGVFIGEQEYWGRGYGRDSVRTLIEHAFNHFGLERIVLYTFADNERARRAYEAAGFKPVRELRRFSMQLGTHSELEMEIVASDQ